MNIVRFDKTFVAKEFKMLFINLEEELQKVYTKIFLFLKLKHKN